MIEYRLSTNWRTWRLCFDFYISYEFEEIGIVLGLGPIYLYFAILK